MHPPHPSDPVLFLDYDGTLAPIVDDPARAFPHPRVPALVGALAERVPLYVVTGRDLQTLARLLDARVSGIGLHGTQVGPLGSEPELLLSEDERRTLDRLRATAPTADGVELEDKGPSFALHYRRAADEAAAVRAIDAWAASVPDSCVVIRGKKVVEVRPAGHDKGVAVRRMMREHAGRTAVYIGDDTTDEDAFRAIADDGVTIHVGDGPTEARYRLPDVESVVAYLDGYLD